MEKSKRLTKPSAGEDVVQLALSVYASESANYYSHFGK